MRHGIREHLPFEPWCSVLRVCGLTLLIGISSFAVYLGLISLSYFADSFTLRPRRKSVVVGVGLLALFLLLIIAEVL
jgi:hypothetical protein